MNCSYDFSIQVQCQKELLISTKTKQKIHVVKYFSIVFHENINAKSTFEFTHMENRCIHVHTHTILIISNRYIVYQV